MNIQQLIALYTQDQRYHSTYPDSRREVLSNLVRHVNVAGNGEGAVIYSQLDEGNVDAIIEEQIAYFTAQGQGFEWKLYDYDTPSDLKGRLTAHGFEIEEAEAIMVLDLATAPPALLQPVTHTIHHLTAPAELAVVRAIEEQVWGEDFGNLVQYLAHTLTDFPHQMSIYVAYIDGVAASAAWIYYPANSHFASLWGGSTLAEYRGRGLYTALLAVRLQEAISRQVSYLTVDASPMSQPILEKFGFVKIADSYPCKWKHSE